MKILFINVSKKWSGRVYKEYPHGVGILGTIADENGHDVSILDMALDVRDPVDVIKNLEPDAIALSFLSPSINEAIDLINNITVFFKGHLFAGGVHSTLFPEDIIAKGVDIVVTGEGEIVLLDLLAFLESVKKKQFSQEINRIPNLVYFDENNEIIYTKKSMESVDLNKLPIMNRSLFNLDLYTHHSILTSRGCPYRCKFCCYWAPGGSSGRVMSKERIINELRYLVDNYGQLQLYWADEIFFWNTKDRLEFCHELASYNLPISLTVQLRADLINDELVIALKKIGCIKICIGAESGSDNILKVANKNLTRNQLEDGIKACIRNKVKVKTWWIIGLPGGTIDDQLLSLEIIEKSMPNEVAIHQFVPLPGSEFWSSSTEYGINLPSKEKFGELTYYCDHNELSFNYLSREQLSDLFVRFEERLIQLGYISTDLADNNSDYRYTSPTQKTTFNI